MEYLAGWAYHALEVDSERRCPVIASFGVKASSRVAGALPRLCEGPIGVQRIGYRAIYGGFGNRSTPNERIATDHKHLAREAPSAIPRVRHAAVDGKSLEGTVAHSLI